MVLSCLVRRGTFCSTLYCGGVHAVASTREGGRWLQKEFYVPSDNGKNKKERRRYELYVGCVTSYNPETQFYKIFNEDGDRKDIERHELVPPLVPKFLSLAPALAD